MEKKTFTLVPASGIDATETAALVNLAFSRYEILKGPRTDAAELAGEAGDTGEFLQRRDERGELIATALIRPASEFFAAYPAPANLAVATAFYFGLAAVHPREMNSGFGGQVLAESERIALERGFRTVVLGTVREFGLVEYYSRRGYIVIGHQDHEAGHWSIAVPHRTVEMVKGL